MSANDTGNVTPTTSSALAHTLRRAGIMTVPTRLREGVYVTGGDPNRRGPVSVSVQIDHDQRHADNLAAAVRDVLDGAGLVYQYRQDDDGYHSFTVEGRRG
jgi:hypothetical protein